MKTLKTCKSGCGKMKSGGKVKSIKRYDNGGTAGDPPVQNLPEVTITGNRKTSKVKKMMDLFRRNRKKPVPAETSPPAGRGTNSSYNAKEATATWKPEGKKGMSVKTKYKDGGTIMGIPQYGNNPRTYSGAILKKGGTTKNAKLAAVAAPKNKVTRADVLTRILKKKKK